MNPLTELDARISGCSACPRLVAWREEVGRVKRAAYQDWTYWARPVPGFGPADASMLVIGLAPAAHGGNRTGRMFTGDRSGDVLYKAMYELGLASSPLAVSLDDGLTLRGVRVTSPVHCAPPENKPTPGERDMCRPWLVREMELLGPRLRSAVILGAFGWQAALPAFAAAGWRVPKPRPRFAHGARVTLERETAQEPGGQAEALAPGEAGPGPVTLYGCFHVSQRNTFTGRLTPDMLKDVLREAAGEADIPPYTPVERRLT
ncbi:uracil-DNA glycosylase [Streptomyces sp. NPDC058644]|uniref:uracil-DNA glycosylase n=1 Tax=unclassified Streptomyces TaxID=2593676 RepID=UPI00364F4021